MHALANSVPETVDRHSKKGETLVQYNWRSISFMEFVARQSVMSDNMYRDHGRLMNRSAVAKI